MPGHSGLSGLSGLSGDFGNLGTIYYVDATNGRDIYSGKSPNVPWQTITKVNAAALKPGDQVLFKRGETFVGQITPTKSGTAGSPIVYGAYGPSGNRPIIDGSAVRAFDIPNENAYFLRVQDIVFSGATGVQVATVRPDSHDLYFYNCAFNNSSAWMGFGAYSVSGSIIYNITVDTCTATGNFATGIFVGSETGVGGPHDVLIVNCTSYNNGADVDEDHGFYVKFGCVIDKCIAYGNFSSGFKLNCELVHNSPFAPILKNSVSFLNRVGIYLAHERAIVYNNLIYANNTRNMEADSDADNCRIYHNTFVNITAASGPCISWANSATNLGNVMMNNLIIQDAAVNPRVCMWAGGASSLADLAANNTFDYNLYYRDGSDTGHMFYDGGPAALRDWNEWRAYTGSPDVHSDNLHALPDFVARYTNLHPVIGGNLEGLGIALIGYERDLDNVLRASPPTPGCYEPI